MTLKSIFSGSLLIKGLGKSDISERQGAVKISSTVLVASMMAASIASTPVGAQQETVQSSNVNAEGYRVTTEGESEFDNANDSYIRDWRESLDKNAYEDTEFGELMYNEASVPTKLEALRLISKDTPSMLVFLTAVSMGLDIESLLKASVDYEPDKGRDFASSAVAILPVLSSSQNYLYSGYELEDLEREDETKPFSVEEVINRFFKGREVLRPYPDWYEGQYHFLASAAELKQYQEPKKDAHWYRARSTDESAERPIFVSLYEATQTVLVDGVDRINKALKGDPEAQLPVVFVFNRLNERSLDDLGYPLTIRGVRDAYTERELMVTPAPEWQQGDYHFYAKMDEVDEVFNLPEEDDFEPQAWQNLIAEAEDYAVTNTSFLLTVLGGGESSEAAKRDRFNKLTTEMAAFDDPRTEGAYPYVAPKDGPAVTLKNVLGQGVILNRPDLASALKTLGVSQIPVAVYYLDSARVKPYSKGPRALIQAVVGAGVPKGTFGGEGGITPPPPPPPVCASPPCND